MRTKRTTLAVAFSLIFFTPLSAFGTHKERIASVTSRAHGTPETGAAQVADAQLKIKRAARGIIQAEIGAPPNVVWSILTDFPRYPEVFKKIKSCRIIKREGDLVFTESYLKPHIFVNVQCQHTVNDLANGPKELKWHMLDGCFKSVEGQWELKPIAGGERCQAIYTLEVDQGGIIPAPIVGMLMHSAQKEIVNSLKHCAESDYGGQHMKTSMRLAPSTCQPTQ